MKKKKNLSALFYPNVPFDELFIPYIYKEIVFDGLYIDVLNGKTDMTILDIGSNIGITVDHFRPHAKKVYAIEPATEHFAALKENKEYNDWDNVEIFNMAIADYDGEATLNFFPSNRTSHSLNNNYGKGGEKVKAMRLDTFLKENKIDNVDFCKMDIEGEEDKVLRSDSFVLAAPKIKAIEIEFHYPNWPELVEIMSKLGYSARRYNCDAIVVLFSK